MTSSRASCTNWAFFSGMIRSSMPIDMPDRVAYAKPVFFRLSSISTVFSIPYLR